MEVIKEDVHGELGDTRGVADHEDGREDLAGAAGVTRHTSVVRPDLWPPRVPRVVGLLLKNGSWMPGDPYCTTPGQTTTRDVDDHLLVTARQIQSGGQVENHPALTGEEEEEESRVAPEAQASPSYFHGGHAAHAGLQSPETTCSKILTEADDAESHCSEHIDTLRGNLWCKCDAVNEMLRFSDEFADERGTHLSHSNHDL